jgi:hypothetical protein
MLASIARVVSFRLGLSLRDGCSLQEKRLVLIALPMGFIDFLVSFATAQNADLFELVVFVLSVVSVLVA